MNAPTIIKPQITVTDLFHMMEQGVINPEARFELVEGEIIRMSPQGPLHQQIQRWLERRFRVLEDRFWVTGGSTLILPENTAVDPDICIYPLDVDTKNLSGDKVALVVEIAVSSRSYDLGRKARLYAQMGVRELWVIDATKRETFVHRGPDGIEWRSIERVPAEGELRCEAAPELVLRLADAG